MGNLQVTGKKQFFSTTHPANADIRYLPPTQKTRKTADFLSKTHSIGTIGMQGSANRARNPFGPNGSGMREDWNLEGF